MHKHDVNEMFLLESVTVGNDMTNIIESVPRFIVMNTNFYELQFWLK
ncbi:biofilm PIA synthesis deacetylase icab precursor [Leuconostoc gelidum JB7]|nr:biofilm PIA synthesis deacetylase icab precursor [Leuconostoc gelidum JB7]